MSSDLLTLLVRSAAAEEVHLRVIETPEDRQAVAVLMRAADAVEHIDPRLPASNILDAKQRLVLFTAPDTRLGWLRTGEALQRVWLEISRSGLWASPLVQLTEVAETREALCAELNLTTTPQVLLRIGPASMIGCSGRRSVQDVLIDSGPR